MSVKVNGIEVSRKEALAMLDDDSTIVTSFSTEIPNKEKSGERTNEGFDIPRELIVEISETMDRTNAGVARVAFTNAGTINGKSIYIFMVAPGYNRWKMFIFRILEKLL